MAEPEQAVDGPVRVRDDDPATMRRQYRAAGLTEEELAGDPYEQFARWFADAVRATGSGLITEPNAMVVSTVGADGAPSSRTVLLKGYDARGFVFFSNHGSRKGRELAGNPRISLLFPWHPMARQVIVTGTARRVPEAETAAYFHSRPHGSQLGAWASEQSSVVASRAVLEGRYAEVAARWPEGTQVPVPSFWGGFRVRATAVEFWQGRENRLHDRLRYVRVAAAAPDDAARSGAAGIDAVGTGADETAASSWRIERLAP